jgi:hypothetical protein
MQIARRGQSLPNGRVVRHSKIGPPMTLWVIRIGLRLGRSPIHVRSTPDSDRKFKALLLVAMCHNRL